jgi:hypothetical protein
VLRSATDYTWPTGSTVQLVANAVNGDIIEIRRNSLKADGKQSTDGSTDLNNGQSHRQLPELASEARSASNLLTPTSAPMRPRRTTWTAITVPTPFLSAASQHEEAFDALSPNTTKGDTVVYDVKPSGRTFSSAAQIPRKQRERSGIGFLSPVG